jgi:hypothetical protein
MSDFFTSLAQTALGSASLVQPRLASRFESASTNEMDSAEVMTDSSPSDIKIVQAEQHTSPISQRQEEREAITFSQSRDSLAFREPISKHLVEHETGQNVITRDLHPSPILASSKHFQAIEQDSPSTQAPALHQSGETKILSPLTRLETREKEILRVYNHTETVTKEKLLQQEKINLELPEIPLLQPVTPAILKLETKATQTPTPTVQVTIGRLEIRTPPQQKTVQQVSQASKPTGVMSLEEYRRKRGLELVTPLLFPQRP